jgi:hypothetical protein
MRSRCALVIAAAVFLPGVARAQVSGSIIGTVMDQSGQPLPGVRITARSETQIGGTKITHSNGDGSFRIPGLLPGVFEVSATAPKLQQVLQRDIHVGITSPAEVDIIMQVMTSVETVKIVETAPTISTTSANLKETYDLEFVSSLPLDNLPTKVEPFVRLNTPGGGADGDRYRGASTRQNLFMVEGFTMVNQRYTMKSLATIEAQTAAFGAENAEAQGAVVNMVTKSGSNRFEFDVSAFYEDNRLAPFQEAADRAAPVNRLALNPGFSGPIIKDKLWYYANIESRFESTAWREDPAGLMPKLPTETVYIGRASFKLTWQISPRHKLSSFTLYNREAWLDRSDGNYDRETDTTYNTPRMSFFSGLTWEALLTDNLFLRSQVGIQGDFDQYIPQACSYNPDCFDIAPIEQSYPRSIKLGNYEQIQYNKNLGAEFVNTLEWFPRTARFGDHDIKLVSRYYVRNETTFQGVPGDHKTVFNGSDPDRLVDYYSNDPRIDDPHRGYFIRDSTGTLIVSSLSDSIRVSRYWSLNPGVGFTIAASHTNSGRGSLSLQGLTPHLSAVWDATHDGRTALRASYAQYLDADAVRVSRYALGDQVQRDCKWDSGAQTFSKDCQFSGGANNVTFGLPCGPQGVTPDGKSCAQKLSMPRMYEYTLGAERELVQGLSLGADFVYRLFTHPYEILETNRIWNGSGSELAPTGSYRNGRAEQVRDLETPDAAQRRYMGITGVIRKRAGAFKIQMGYTWSKLEGNVDNSAGDNNPYGDIAGRDVYLWGYLHDDRRHDIRGAASYQVNSWLSLGTTYSYSSGSPYSRLYRNQTTAKYEDYRARVGINPGANPNDPGDDRELRLPDVQRLNIKVQVNWRPLLGFNLESYVDFLNILNLRTVTAVTTDDGQNFNAPRTLMTPMLVRLGARYRY